MGIQTATKEQLTDRTLAAAGTLQNRVSRLTRCELLSSAMAGIRDTGTDFLSDTAAALCTARMSCCSRTSFVLAGYGCWDAICLTGMNFETGRDPFSGGIEGLMGQLFRDRIIRYLPNGGSKPR